MRISDWSSDVCSSDLLGKRFRTSLCPLYDDAQSGSHGGGPDATGEEGEDRAAGLAGSAEQSCPTCGSIGPARCHERRSSGGDRKSVVEGKSVSVRVNIGGRRINKKQQNI